VSKLVDLDTCYLPSEDIVSREIEGELIIVPIVSGIGDMEDDLYTLNETGREIWRKLDGQKNLRRVVQELTAEFEAPQEEIERDVIGLVGELLRRKMIIEVDKE